MAQTRKTTKTTAAKPAGKPASKTVGNTVPGAIKAAADIEATIKNAADTAGAEIADMFATQGIEVPEFVRQASENAVASAQDGYARIKSAAENATDVLEETVQSARGGLMDIQSKALDAAKENSESAFAFAKEVMTTATIADAVQLQSAFIRGRFEAMMDYSRAVQETTSDVTTAATKPARDAFAKIVADAKAA